MQTKTERDVDFLSMAPEQVGRQDGPATMAPQAVAQRAGADRANASARLDQQRQAASTMQRKADEVAAPNRTGLPDQLKAGIESLSGVSLDGVKVHYNSAQPAQLQAHAFAQGTDIHVGPGQEKHLPHEAWHVVQQAQGRVRPTMQLKAALDVNDDQSLEREADVMGALALGVGAGSQVPAAGGALAHDGASKTIQRLITIEDVLPPAMPWSVAYLHHVYPHLQAIMAQTGATEKAITDLLKTYDQRTVSFKDADKLVEVIKQELTIGLVERSERIRLESVSLASEIHHLNKLSEKFLGVMTQPWGFSFVDVARQVEDVVSINDYVLAWNRNQVQAPMHVANGRKIEYTLPNNRVYSTHDDSSQLYPIRGPGVYRGNGAGDMYRILKALGKDTQTKVIQLDEAQAHSQTDEFKEASEEKMAGGHRSGVKIPKAKVTSAGNIELMKEAKREKLVKEAVLRLLAIPTSGQFSLGV